MQKISPETQATKSRSARTCSIVYQFSLMHVHKRWRNCRVNHILPSLTFDCRQTFVAPLHDATANTSRNFHVFHYAYSFPHRCAISRLEASTEHEGRSKHNLDRRWIVAKFCSVSACSKRHRERPDWEAGKFWSKVSADTMRSRQFIPLEFSQDLSVLRIGYDEKCQTRETARVYAIIYRARVGEDRSLANVMMIRAIQRDVDWS